MVKRLESVFVGFAFLVLFLLCFVALKALLTGALLLLLVGYVLSQGWFLVSSAVLALYDMTQVVKKTYNKVFTYFKSRFVRPPVRLLNFT